MPQAASQPSPAAAASAASGEPWHAGSSAAGVSGGDRALASCLYPLGGGDTRAGHGDFPVAAAMRHACVQRIAHYLVSLTPASGIVYAHLVTVNPAGGSAPSQWWQPCGAPICNASRTTWWFIDGFSCCRFVVRCQH